MKKLFFVIVITALVFSLAGISVAAESERVVGDDIEIGEDEVKIVSISDDDGDMPVSDEVVFDDPDRDAVVGEDIEIGEGEFKIISLPAEDGDAPVSNDDANAHDRLEQDAVVGDDIEIGEGEFKIISVDAEESADAKNPFNWPLAAGIAGGVILIAGAVFFLIKKVL